MAYVQDEEDPTLTPNVEEKPNPTISTGVSPDVTEVTGAAKQTLDTSTTNPNAQKVGGGTGFTNIQRYLTANRPGGENLGAKVSEQISGAGDQAVQAINTVGQNAQNYPGVDVVGSQADQTAQQAITNANQKAALSFNIPGQTQLIRDFAPTTTQGGLNLDQFLVQNSQGYNKLADASKAVAPLQDIYGNTLGQIQSNINTYKAALAKVANPVPGATVTPPVPTTAQVPTYNGATTTNPYQGLSQAQINYLKTLQAQAKKTAPPVPSALEQFMATPAGMVGTGVLASSIASNAPGIGNFVMNQLGQIGKVVNGVFKPASASEIAAGNIDVAAERAAQAATDQAITEGANAAAQAAAEQAARDAIIQGATAEDAAAAAQAAIEQVAAEEAAQVAAAQAAEQAAAAAAAEAAASAAAASTATAAGFDAALAAGGSDWAAGEVIAAVAEEAAADWGIGEVIVAIAAWVICTELTRQHRMPMRYYVHGSRVFANYDEVGKDGYYIWAIPSVRHLRKHPNSLYSKFLEKIFNWRAENIAAHAGVKGARKLWRGAAVTAALYPLCWVLGRTVCKIPYFKRQLNWNKLYETQGQ